MESRMTQRDVLTLKPGESIKTDAQNLRERKVGAPFDLGDEIEEILSEREITMAVTANSPGARSETADAASIRRTTCTDNDRCNYFNDAAIDLLANGSTLKRNHRKRPVSRKAMSRQWALMKIGVIISAKLLSSCFRRVVF